MKTVARRLRASMRWAVLVGCLTAMSGAMAGLASAQVPALDPLPVVSEPVPDVQQPDTSVLPVFNATFAAPGAAFGARIRSDLSGDYAAYTGVTTGGGDVFVSSEARADVTVFDG